jgi:CRISPR-associated protein Cmr3
MPAYFVLPDDTLFFRGGEPMELGESHFQTSIFPPSPETFIGAIRSLIIARGTGGDFEGYKSGKCQNEPWYQEIGPPDSIPSGFKFFGPFLASKFRNGDYQLLFSPPSNLFVAREGNGNRFAISTPKKLKEVRKSGKLEYLMWLNIEGHDEDIRFKAVPGLLTESGLKKYLNGTIEDLIYKEGNGEGADIIEQTHLMEDEPRVGIALKKEQLVACRVAHEGRLYQTNHKRFKEGVGFIFFLDGVNSFPEKDIIGLGGENRTAHYWKIDNRDILSKKGEVNFLVTLMPLKVKKVIDGLPLVDFITEDLEVELPGGIKSEIVSCSLQRAQLFGGWDIAKNEPKSMVPYLPAGSVFYFGKREVTKTDFRFSLGG